MIVSQSITAPSFAHTPRRPVQGCLTISRRTPPRCALTQSSKGPSYPLSAQITWRRGRCPTSAMSNTLPPSRSPMSAVSTLTDISRPSVSTNRCRFLPRIFFPPIVPTLIATHRTGFDRLTVENSRTWFCFPAHRDTQFSSQRSIDLFPNPLLFPSTDIPIDREPTGTIAGEHSPSTDTPQH